MNEKIDSAIRMMENSGEEILSTGGASDTLIEQAEVTLGVKFPADYKYFLQKYGSLSFESEEFYGLTHLGLKAKSIPCTLFATKSAVKSGDISEKMIKIKSTGYGPVFSIDLTQGTMNAPVIETNLSYKRDKEKLLIADSFGDFFYNEIQTAINEL